MKRPIMAGNWKMNMTPAESVVLSQSISNRYKGSWDKVDVVLFPPSIDLRSVFTVLDFDKSLIEVVAQNVHWEPSGAYTGEISIPMLKDVGCTWCIVGHSERRSMFGARPEVRKISLVRLPGSRPAGLTSAVLGIRFSRCPPSGRSCLLRNNELI